MQSTISTPRIIGHYQGQEAGPLVIAIGGTHGNEPAGVRALERLFELLDEEPKINPGFVFAGELLALRGNLEALARGQRFLDADLNRSFDPDRIQHLRRQRATPFEQADATSEENEILALLDAIEIAVDESAATEITLLDLHTTTADGGIFTITADDPASLELGSELYAPVILGMLDGVEGTTLHYFRDDRLGAERKLTALTFEAGQHDDPASVDRALAATINLLRALGCVQSADVRTLHDEVLQQYARELPLTTRLAYAHRIGAEDGFRMRPGYVNFQPVAAGDILAEDRNGPVRAPISGYILMPLYQTLGNEGFFIVQDHRPEVAF